MSQTPAERLEGAIRSPQGDVARLVYLTAGHPRRAAFADRLARCEADALLVGVPFSDPVDDGLSDPAVHRAALADGASLRWVLSVLGQVQPAAPVVLASYVNPLLAYGLHRLVRDLAELGVTGLLVHDLPFEESDEIRRLCAPVGLAVVGTVAASTPLDRARRVCAEATGFVHVVGGGSVARVRAVSPRPVCASGDATGADGVVLRADAHVVHG